MKKLSLITAGLIAAGLVSSASAQTVVRITGSTAFRTLVNNALEDNVNGSVFVAGTRTVINNAASGQRVYSGTIGTTAGVIVKTSFTGSEAGIANIVNQAVDNSQPGHGTANLAGTPTATFYNNTGTTLNEVTNADISMADTSPLVSLTSNPSVVDQGIVGIVQFSWLKGKNNSQANWANLKNVAVNQINVLLGAGQQDLSFFTGSSTDVGTGIVAVGRNKGSGTRVNELIQSLYGIKKDVKQYAVSPNYTAGVLDNAVNTTAISDGAISLIGNDGFDSGSGVIATMQMTKSGTLTTIPIGAAGLGDANGYVALIDNGALTGATFNLTHASAAPLNNAYLSDNGVYYSDDAIINGAYDFWGHEHILTGSFASPTGLAVKDKLKTALAAAATGGVNGINTGAMFVDRTGGADTGFPQP